MKWEVRKAAERNKELIEFNDDVLRQAAI